MDAENPLRDRPRPAFGLTILLPGLLGLLATTASAQPSLGVSLGRNLTSMSGSADANADHVTTAAVEAEHQFAGERIRVFYDFEGGAYDSGADWRYYLQSAGTTFKAPLGNGGTTTLFVSAFGAWQANGGAWNAPGYRALSGRANLEWRPRPTATLRTGYLLNHRVFADFGEMNHLEQDAFASLLLNLPTRTTIVGETHVGGKSYQRWADETLAASTSGQSGAHGSGGRGLGPGLRAGAGAASDRGTSKQLNWLARVAQSLTDRTGAWIQVAQRTTFGSVPPPVIATPALYFDDGVYDDPFASDAFVVTLNGKHQFARGMALEAQASTARKNYNSTLALDLGGLPVAGDLLRRDRIERAGVAWTVPLFSAKTGPVGLNLRVGYAFARHRSNGLYYNYTSHGLGLNVSVVY